MTNEYDFLKKLRYEYYKGTTEIMDNEVNELVEDVVDRLNTQDYNKNELLKIKQFQDQQIEKLKEKLKKSNQEKIKFAIDELRCVKRVADGRTYLAHYIHDRIDELREQLTHQHEDKGE